MHSSTSSYPWGLLLCTPSGTPTLTQCPVTLEQDIRHYPKDIKKEIKTNLSRSESRSELNHPQIWKPAQMSKYKHTKVFCFTSFQRWINREERKNGMARREERKG